MGGSLDDSHGASLATADGNLDGGNLDVPPAAEEVACKTLLPTPNNYLKTESSNDNESINRGQAKKAQLEALCMVGLFCLLVPLVPWHY